MTTHKNLLILGYFFLIAFLVFSWRMSIYFGEPIQHFTGDPSKVFETHPFIGMISNVGILFWCATSSICLFTFFLKNREISPSRSRFILGAGLFTLFLLIDDLFMLHEEVWPLVFHTSHKRIMVVYVLLGLGFLYLFRKQIMSHYFPTFLLAGFFLGGSVAMDMLLPNEGIQHLFEDGFKLLGIFTWMVYFIKICFAVLKE